MPGNLLAEEVVRIVAEGLVEAEASTDRLGTKLDKMGQSARMAESFVAKLSKTLAAMASGPSRMFAGIEAGIRRLGDTVSKIAASFRLLSIGGAFGIAGIAHSAMSGTVEAQRLGKAWELLARVVGDRLAPYVEALSAGIVSLASWFDKLSDSTKDNLTQWALIATGISAVAALLPVVIAGAAGIAAAFAAITSPITLTIAAMAGLGVAAAKMFGMFEDGSVDAANAMQDSNKGWLESLTKGIQAAINAMAKMFNWIMQKAAQVSDWIAHVIAQSGEFLGLLPEGTTKELGKMDAIKPFQIDTGGIDVFFDKLGKRARDADGTINELAEAASNIGNNMKAALDKAKKDGGGFHIKTKVGFESGDQTWQRLQTAFNENAGARISLDRQQLAATQEVAKNTAGAIGALFAIRDLLPAVR